MNYTILTGIEKGSGDTSGRGHLGMGTKIDASTYSL